MLRRSTISLLRRSVVLHGGHGHGGAHDSAAREAVTVFAPAEADASATHARSGYAYAAFSGEVGARNEAAFVDYKEFQPKTLVRKLAMPDALNLVTILPVQLLVFFAAVFGWGVLLWDLYARRHYVPIVIEAPVRAK